MIRDQIAALVRGISAHDSLEEDHKTAILEWIASGAPLFRIRKPDVPNRHLVSYIVLTDPARGQVLLVDHKNAGLWLPCGGHVEPDEDPAETVRRELVEELRLEPTFLYRDPFFVTLTRTVGVDSGHDDVSLWYVLKADSTRTPWFDENEFNALAWFGFDEIPFERSDPHLRRFMNKLYTKLEI